MPEQARMTLQAYANSLKICNSLWMMQNQSALDEATYILENFHPMAGKQAPDQELNLENVQVKVVDVPPSNV